MRTHTLPLLLPLVVFTGCSLLAEETTSPDLLLDAEIATVGMDHFTGTPVVLVREVEHGRTVSIWIGIPEAQAILQALHEIEMPRPMTHDLAVNLVEAAGAEIEEVQVYDMRNGIFYGRILMRREGQEELVEVDCRPSDGLALAVRTGARLKITERIAAEAPDVDFVPPETTEQVVQVLGLTIVTVTDALREELQLGERTGVVVTGVRDVAEEEGFRRGDLIIRVNEIVPETPMEFLEEVIRTPAGGEAEVRILRDGEERDLRLPVGAESQRSIPI